MAISVSDSALVMFLVLGSLVLFGYGVMWFRGTMGDLWQSRMRPAGEGVLAAWTASAVVTTASVIGISAILIGGDERDAMLPPFGTFLGCATLWPLLFIVKRGSVYPKFEPIALAAVALASAWLCLAAFRFGQNVLLFPFTVVVLVHHTFIDGLWWPSR